MANSTYTLQNAIELATFAHLHQKDKAGEPYINHPMRVLQSVQAQGGSAYAQIAAVLHDVTEDTPFTLDMLRALGVPEAAVVVVGLMDRHEAKRLFADQEAKVQQLLDSWSGLSEVELAFAKREWENTHPGFFARDSDEFYYGRIKGNPAALLVKKADIGDNTQPWRLEYLSDDTRDRLRRKYDKALEMLGAL